LNISGFGEPNQVQFVTIATIQSGQGWLLVKLLMRPFILAWLRCRRWMNF